MNPSSNLNEILRELNAHVINKGFDDKYLYYLRESDAEKTIISNAPNCLHNHKAIKEFPLGKGLRTDTASCIDFFSKIFNYIQFENPEAVTGDSNIKPFMLNECTENSKIVYLTLSNLNESRKFNCITPPEIVLGYIERKIDMGILIGNLVNQIENLYLSDWHVWNCVDGILIDMTLFKDKITEKEWNNKMEWGNAESHVMLTPATGIKYFGISFNNFEEYSLYENQLFELQSS